MVEVLAALAAAGWVYPLLRRFGVWVWLAGLVALGGASLAVATLDLGPGSVLLGLGLGAGITVACWRARPSPAALGLALVLGIASIMGWTLADTDPTILSGAGLALVATAVLALAASAGVGGAPAGLRWACGLVLVFTSAAVAATGGDALAPLVWGPAAGALGLTALLRGRRRTAAGAAQKDEVDDQVLADFTRAQGDLLLPPVAVVIAAYNEAPGLPEVLASLPREVLGLATEILVVDDGSTDGTAETVRQAGRSLLVGCPVNRGQGRALRLGYRLAREHGAAYVVTTDADGQYSPDDLATVLAPVVGGRADFVTGSRRLGALESSDTLRQVGTYVFAWLASLLLGRRLTDTSFGLRAMRAEVTEAVTLNEPQYQASELLVGVVSHGFRVLEVPATMRSRSTGATKKGGNVAYGVRYARVMLGTWWREGCPRPVAECAPALQGSTRDVPDAADVPA
jgi:hypothetical protein